MKVYNKLKIAILAILASQSIHAITIDPVQIQSAPGELLYAEINFRHSDIHTPMQASLASAEDLIRMGAGHQPPGHLNFFTRRDSSGNGVITITSSRPVTDAELNIIVKITEGNASRLQHIKTPLKRSPAQPAAIKAASSERPLTPVRVINEKDISLSLPVSTQYAPPAPKAPAAVTPAAVSGLPLSVSASAPPGLSSPALSALPAFSENVQTRQTAIQPEHLSPAAQPAAAPQKPQAAAAETAMSQDPLVQKYAAENAQRQAAQQAKAETPPAPRAAPAAPAPAASGASQQQYVVQSNETLWGIASRIASEQKRPVSDVMKQIKTSNEHAFIQGDSNRLRRGAALNLNHSGTAKPQLKVNAAELAKVPSSQSGKAKYRLNQAEMSLISEKEQDSAQKNANKNTEKNQTSDKLSLKIMTSREKTVKLQRNVTQLELALNQKDQRIQLLNARLAELETKLKAQRAAKKPIQ